MRREWKLSAAGLVFGVGVYVVIAAFADLLVGSQRGLGDPPPRPAVVYPNL